MSRTWIVRVAAFFMAVILFLSGCTSTPASKNNNNADVEPPEWVVTRPTATAQSEFFVGYSTDNAGDPAKAEEQAVASLINEITRYLGVRVTSESTAEAKASLDDFETRVTQTVKQQGSAQMAGFRIADKFIDQRDGKVTVYLLGEYGKRELEEEKARLEAIFKEQRTAISGPELEGQRLEGRGDIFGAVQKYIEAAVAASTSSVENAEIKFERNINNAKNAVGKISLIPVTNNLEGFVGQAFTDEFVLKVVRGASENDPGVAAADITVSYKIMRSNGRIGVQNEVLKTDDEGYLYFSHPVPNFVGSEKVTMAINLEAFLEPLLDVPRAYRRYVEGLEDIINDKKAVYEYSVISKAKDIPTGVVILDLDAGGNPTGSSRTASGVLESLSQSGFSIRSLDLDPGQLENWDDAATVDFITSEYGNIVDRAVFGIVTIDSFDESGNGYMVKVTGTIKAVDLLTGEVLYTKSMFSRNRGSSSDGAVSAAFRSLGVKFGEELAVNLP